MDSIRTHCRHKLLLCLLVLMPSRAILAQEETPEDIAATTDRLDLVMTAYHDAGLFNGVALVRVGDQVYLKKGYGPAVRGWEIPNDAETRMLIASVSKQFTAAIILLLAEDGLIDLDRPVGNYLPDVRQDIGDRISARQLLNHTAGVRRDLFSTEEEINSRHTRQDLLDAVNTSGLHAEPGEGYAYSNLGYTMLALMAEHLSGSSFTALLRQRVFDPLSMDDTGVHNKYMVNPRLAEGYVQCAGQFITPGHGSVSIGLGAGGIYSTVHDLLKWDKALYDDRLLNTDSRTQMFTPAKNNYAMGWFVRPTGPEVDGVTPVYAYHNGDGDGFAANFTRFPGDQFTIILLSNQDFLPRSPIFNQITNAVNGGDLLPIGERFTERLYPMIFEGRLEEALEAYRAAADDRSIVDFPRAMVIHNQGFHLGLMGRHEDARKIHEFNILAHPEQWFGYIGLGDIILEVDHDFDEAKPYLLKALEVDPGNQYALERLERHDDTHAAPDDPAPLPSSRDR